MAAHAKRDLRSAARFQANRGQGAADVDRVAVRGHSLNAVLAVGARLQNHGSGSDLVEVYERHRRLICVHRFFQRGGVFRNSGTPPLRIEVTETAVERLAGCSGRNTAEHELRQRLGHGGVIPFMSSDSRVSGVVVSSHDSPEKRRRREVIPWRDYSAPGVAFRQLLTGNTHN